MRTKKAIYNILTNLLLQIAMVIYGFVVPKIIIDHFGSDVNGLTVSITQFLAYITLLESGFGPVVKAALYKPIANKDKKVILGILRTSEKFFRRIALIFIGYIVVLCIFFPLIAKADFDAIFTISLVIVIGLSTFAEYFFGMSYRLFLQAKQKTYIISIIQILTYILAILLVIILALLNADVIIIKLTTGLVFLLRPLIQNLYVRKKYNINLKEAPSEYPIKQKWDGLAQHIAWVIHDNTDITILTIFTNLAEVSVYSVYRIVLSGIKRIIQAFNNGIDSMFGDMIAKKEEENLRNKFSSYELLYMMITTILFTTTLLLITPFVQVYTKDVTDTDYIRPLFGYLLTISEFIWAIRLPYNSLTIAAGHFRETRVGAWVEAMVNIIISVVLVSNFGMVGVAIGTIVAMLIRTAEFVYHANKHILKRSVWSSIGKILISALIAAIGLVVFNLAGEFTPNNYIDWVCRAILVVLIVTPITLLSYCIIYRKDMRRVVLKVKSMIKRKRKR